MYNIDLRNKLEDLQPTQTKLPFEIIVTGN